jgi:deferrochelatase/peroxidase EfeB
MRPRADHKRDLGKDDDFVKGQFTNPLQNDTSDPPGLEVDSDEEPDQGPDKEDASVILRRGITFGPELGPDETEKTTKSRGIYFTCYQSDIRDGFNLLMTRKSPSPHCS